MRRYKLWWNGQWQEGRDHSDIKSPFDGQWVAQIGLINRDEAETAVNAASSAFGLFKKTSRSTRSTLLAKMGAEIAAHKKEFVHRIVSEAGKPFAQAETEVDRATFNFNAASEEAKRYGGELIPVDLTPSSEVFAPAQCFFVPRGPVLAITPFNFPLNLIAHKVAPALACGSPVIVKPPPQAPGAAILLAEIFERCAVQLSKERDSIPLTTLQVLNAENSVTETMVAHPLISTLSFTGSDAVGWKLKAMAAKKKVVLELGGNASVIVHNDADIVSAAQRCAFGSFAYAGQVCISVQRILVHQSIYEDFKEALVRETKALMVGNPENRSTVVGPIIDERNKNRILSWIQEACSNGAQCLTGGNSRDTIVYPTILENAKAQNKVMTEEAFGPVVTIEPYSEITEAIERINSSRFGLQAGLFTDSTRAIRLAIENLNVGGLTINEIPTFRADNLPYGGVKDSGIGREGVRFAMLEYSDTKTVVERVQTPK